MNEFIKIIIIITVFAFVLLWLIIWNSQIQNPVIPNYTNLPEGESIYMKGLEYKEMEGSTLLFTISADSGTFVIDSGEGVIENIKGKILLKNEGVFSVKSKDGKISDRGNTIYLGNGAYGEMDDGTQVFAESIYFDIKGNKSYSNDKVKLISRNAVVTASSMDLNLSNGIISFIGDVDAVISKQMEK
ncbi:MAG TPA: LPS export ABC transporter periplasmic protein LptC [bacterium]